MHILTALACIAVSETIAPLARAQAPAMPSLPFHTLPPHITVDLQNGHFHVAPPADMCDYPEPLRAAVGQTMPNFRIMIAAVACKDVDPGLVVTRSTLLVISERDLASETRLGKAAFLKECFLQFSPERGNVTFDKTFTAFNKGGFGASVDNPQVLGLMRLTQDAVFGGTRYPLEAGGRTFVITRVLACTVFSYIPVIWIFQTLQGDKLPQDDPGATFGSLLAVALRQVEESQRLNAK